MVFDLDVVAPGNVSDFTKGVAIVAEAMETDPIVPDTAKRDGTQRKQHMMWVKRG